MNRYNMRGHDEGRLTRGIAGTALLGGIAVGVLTLGWQRPPQDVPLATAKTSEPIEHRMAITAQASEHADVDSGARTAIDSAAQPSKSTVQPLDDARAIVALDLLREIAQAQRTCQEQAVIDVDGDRRGEFGYLGELTGMVRARAAAGEKSPRLHCLARSKFGRIEGGIAVHAGYCFRMYLPGPGGVPVGEADNGGAGHPAPDPQRASQQWSCYAWPVTAGETTAPTLFVDQSERVIVTSNVADRYVGRMFGPAPDAARGLRTTGRTGEPTALADAEGLGRDGEVWREAHAAAVITVALRIVDSSTRPVPDSQVRVIVDPRTGGRLGSELLAQRAALRTLEAKGFRLPLGSSGTADDAGEVVLNGPPATGLAIALRHPDERDASGRVLVRGATRLPPQITLRDDVLHVVLPPAAEPAVRANANESAAIATLKNLASAQAQCRASASIDVDRDGEGEYGYLGELAGGSLVRARSGLSEERISPPFLSGAFGKFDEEQSPAAGIILRSGYCFQVWLPDAGRARHCRVAHRRHGHAAP